MNKKLAGAVAGLCLGCVSAASALDLSVGGGGFFSSDFGGGLVGIQGESSDGKKASETTPWLGGGVHLFFDATYAEIGLGLTFGSGTPQFTYDGETEKSDYSISFIGLGIGVLGKYPIPLSESISIFPAVGIDYDLCLSAKDEDGDEVKNPGAEDLSALWFKFGAGLDCAITDAIYLRPELLYGIRLANKAESDFTKDRDNIDPALGHGLTVKVGVGFKL